MQNKDIEIFLEIVQSRNITKAAEHLFLSQSVISTRLKKLEEELGYELFTRSKGVREMELTRQGREFVSIAVRWKNLFEEAVSCGSALSICSGSPLRKAFTMIFWSRLSSP